MDKQTVRQPRMPETTKPTTEHPDLTKAPQPAQRPNQLPAGRPDAPAPERE